MNTRGFKYLCQALTTDLFTWVVNQLTEYYGSENVVATDDYFFCSGNIPTMLCAHCDTVHNEQPETFIEDEYHISSPQGIGGDDRCGIYAILAILRALEPSNRKPYVFLSTDEEVGGASTRRAAKDVMHKIANVNYLIELDRANSVDSVYYRCDNKEFQDWINSFGFKEAVGTNTDICTLCKEWDVAGVNLSVGYYNNHQLSEYVVYKQLDETINKVKKIIDATEDKMFPFCEKKASTYAAFSWSNKGLFLGDAVYTLRAAPCYEEKELGSTYIKDIPPYTSGRVVEVSKFTVKIKIPDGSLVWVSNWDVHVDIGK